VTTCASATVAAAGGGSAVGSFTTVATTSPSLTYTGCGSVYGGRRRGSQGTTCALNTKLFKGTRLRTLVSACLQEHGTRLASKQVEEFTTTASRVRTYILERTRDFFIGRPDEPCSGAARLVPTDLTVALPSPGFSGAVLPTSAMAGVGPWPPPAARETCTYGTPPPRIINDRRRRGVAPESTSCDALGVNAEPVDLARDRHLCKESESGRSEPLKRWRDGVARSSGRLGGSVRRGGSLRASEALKPPGAMRGRVA
jgi:hypothetical protein